VPPQATYGYFPDLVEIPEASPLMGRKGRKRWSSWWKRRSIAKVLLGEARDNLQKKTLGSWWMLSWWTTSNMLLQQSG